MPNIPLATKPKTNHMLDHDSFLTVTEEGLNRRVERKDLEVDEDISLILDGYINEHGELMLVLGDMFDNNPATVEFNYMIPGGGGSVGDFEVGPVESVGDRLSSSDETVATALVAIYGVHQLGHYSGCHSGEKLSDSTDINSVHREENAS